MTRIGFAVAFFCSAAVFADEVILHDGRVVEGKVEDLGNEIRVTKGKNAITFPRAMVREIRYKPTKEDDYVKMAGQIDDKDPQAHYELGLWCKDNGLREQSEKEFRRAIELNPNHKAARQALGYREHEGKWLTEDEFHAAQGLVKYKGEWISKEEKELAEEIERAKEAEKDILKQVRKALADIAGTSEKRQSEAESILGSIGWEFKLKIFISHGNSYSTRVRRYVSGQLGDSKDASAVPVLGRLWLYDQDETVRENAERSLSKLNAKEPIFNILLRALFSDRRDVPMRAVEGLRDHKDPRSIPYLVDFLQAVMEELGQVSTAEAPGESKVTGRPIKLPDGTETVIPKRVQIRSPMKELEEQDKLKQNEQLEADKVEIAKTLNAVSGLEFGADLVKWRTWLTEQAKKAKEGQEKK
jgi:hypothetical protein